MQKSDTYLAEACYPLDEIQRDVLSYLYLPLIGNEAYSLYQFLSAEARRMQRVHREVLMTRITNSLNLSIDHLEDASKMLAGIGLLKIYKKSATHYLFVLKAPLSLKKFFHNALLVSLLKHTIGKEELALTESYFRITVEDKKAYEEENVSFNDIFSVDLKAVRPLKTKGHMASLQEGIVNFDYDLTLFYETLKEDSLPMHQIRNQEGLIKQMGILYNLDAITLASLVRDSMQNGSFQPALFKETCHKAYYKDHKASLNEVYHRTPEKEKSIFETNDPLSQHLAYLESVSPYELLKSKQGGAEPVLHDLEICENLMMNLHLSPGVVNVLIEYVLTKNNNHLAANYCETIAAAWARKKIKTARAAYEETIAFNEKHSPKNRRPVDRSKTSPAPLRVEPTNNRVNTGDIDLGSLMDNIK